MTNSDLYSWFIVATVVSVLAGFLLSLRRTSKRFGSTYGKAIFDAWIGVLTALLPIIIYSVVSVVRGGWGQIFYSPELSVTALVILFMGCHELCLGLTVQHSWHITPRRLALLAGWALLWLVTAAISVVLIYQASSVPGGAVFWQIVLLVAAILTYFSTAVPTRLLRAGYVPKASKV